jgi:hypothetical protein
MNWTVLAVVLLLASASTASAECAWVLWTYISSSSTKTAEERWRPLSSYATQTECQDHQEKMREKASDRAAASGVRLVTHQCFPDTVDPRGPKVK